MNAADVILQEYRLLENEEQKANLSRFFKTGRGQYGEGDLFLGVKVPQTRLLVKKYHEKVALPDLRQLIASPYHEVRLFALLALVQKFIRSKNEDEKREFVDFYLSHTRYINNWDLVDLSCYEILGNWLLDKDRGILYRLAESKNLWEQRIAMVSCMQFVRHSQFDDCLAMAEILHNHPHDLIQKAVGWLLREVGKRDEERLKDFLSEYYKTMPRTELRYAIEKFPPEIRRKYLNGEI